MGSTIVSLAGWLVMACAWQWDSPPTSGAQNRRGHSMTLFKPTQGIPVMLSCGGEDDSLFVVENCYTLDPFTWRFQSALTMSRPRSDQISVQLPGKDMVVIWGGTTNKLDPCDIVIPNPWQLHANASCTGTAPDGTWGSSITVSALNMVVVFGGASGSASSPGQDNQIVHLLDTSAAPVLAWSRPAIADVDLPARRHYHAAAAWNNFVVIFGGVTVTGTLLSDVWLLETDSTEWLWLQLPTASAPQLYGHEAFVVGSLFVVVGGQETSSSSVYVSRISDRDTWSFSSPAADGLAPRAGYRGCAVRLDADGDADPDIVVYGGSITVSGIPTSAVTVLSAIGFAEPTVAKELPYIIAGAAGAFVLLGGLAMCAYRRRNRPAGLSAMLAAMSSKPYEHSTEEEEAEAERSIREPLTRSASAKKPMYTQSYGSARQASSSSLKATSLGGLEDGEVDEDETAEEGRLKF